MTRPKWRRHLFGAALGAAALGAAGLLAPTYYTDLLSQALIFAILAMGVNLLLGYTGLPSLGHAAFFGTGAYATGLTAVRTDLGFWVDTAAGLLSAAVVAAVLGALALRATAAYFLMITLAMAQVLWAVAFGWRSLTNGDDGVPGIPRPDLGVVDWDFWDPRSFFLLTLIVFCLVSVAMYLVVHSPFGRALRGIREAEPRMQALGYNTWLYKYIAFVLSGLLAGLAGVLFVYFHGFVSPEALFVVVSGEAMLMVILGGAGTLMGPPLGAGIIVFARHLISANTERWLLALGLVYILLALLARRGIIGELMLRSRRWSGPIERRP
jgi:branched-chain amino acid transport system permease protein